MVYYNLHDLLTIGLNNAPKNTLEYFYKRLGNYSPEYIENELDISISFVNKVSLVKDTYFLGYKLGTVAAYNDQGIILINKNTKMLVSNDNNVPPKYNIICEVDFNPGYLYDILFRSIIPTIILEKNACIVHTAAIYLNNTTILFPAWMDTGKTSLLLSFAEKGADYVAEEIAFVNKEGYVLSIPTIINIADPKLVNNYLSKFSSSYRGLRFQHLLRSIFKKWLVWNGHLLQKINIFPAPNLGALLQGLGENLNTNILTTFQKLFPNRKIVSKCFVNFVVFPVRYSGSNARIREVDNKQQFIERIVSETIHDSNFILQNYSEVRTFINAGQGKDIIYYERTKHIKLITDFIKDKQCYWLDVPIEDDVEEAVALIIKKIIKPIE
jgi:hypothetical protein